MKLVTFDIFDTTLIRRCGVPEGVFHLLAEKLWPGESIRHIEYMNLRCQAAARCGTDATLEDIYSQEGFSLFPEYSSSRIMAAELAVESEMLTVNPRIKEKIEEFRTKGWTVKFLSDMYLPSDFLAEILRREGCLAADEEVIVSCEWHARKDTGALYLKVRGKYNPDEWIHYGDNRRSDYRVARKQGVRAVLVDFGFSPVEQRLNATAAAAKDGWKIWLLTGASRTARIKYNRQPVAAIAADYIAALYIPFVLWVLKSARKNGIRRLHFLSRDGYIMQRIAEAADCDDIQFNYLFVSRKALMRAYLKNDSAKRFVEITDKRSLISQRVDALLGRLQLDRGMLHEKYGIDFGYNQILSSSQQQDFIGKLFGNGTFAADLKALFETDGALTEEYLRQEGLIDGTSQAMVDIGWLGTSRLMINRILATNIPTFYVGVRADVYDRSCGDYDSFFSAGQLSTSATGLVENYFSASPWPSTIGYEHDTDGHIVPRFVMGEKFTPTEITEVNESVCRSVMTDLQPYIGLMDDNLLFDWAKISLDSLTDMTDKQNLEPLMKSADFDGTPMVRKLNPLQVLNFVFAGARYTAFDRGAIDVTLGSGLGRLAWRLHCRAAALRGYLFRLLVKFRNK